jgi:hypothetical protein
MKRENLAAQVELKTEESKELRLSIDAMARSATFAHDRERFYKDAYQATRDDLSEANADARSPSILSNPILWYAFGAVTVAVVVALTKSDEPAAVIVTP